MSTRRHRKVLKEITANFESISLSWDVAEFLKKQTERR